MRGQGGRGEERGVNHHLLFIKLNQKKISRKRKEILGGQENTEQRNHHVRKVI